MSVQRKKASTLRQRPIADKDWLRIVQRATRVSSTWAQAITQEVLPTATLLDDSKTRKALSLPHYLGGYDPEIYTRLALPFPHGDPRELTRLNYLEMKDKEAKRPDVARARYKEYMEWWVGGRNIVGATTSIRLPGGRTEYVWGESVEKPVDSLTLRSLDPRASRKGREIMLRHTKMAWMRNFVLSLARRNPERASRIVVGMLYVYRDALIQPKALQGRACTLDALATRFKLTRDQVREAVKLVRSYDARLSKHLPERNQ